MAIQLKEILKSSEVKLIQHYVIKVCQWFSPGSPVSSTNKTDCHDITEIVLKVALSTINLTYVFSVNFNCILSI
jgi:hypothetical protein